MDIPRVFSNLRPDATYKDNMVNFHSLEKIAETFIGAMPTQVEMDAEWVRIQSEDIPRDEAREQLTKTDAEMARISEDLYKHVILGIEISQRDKDEIESKLDTRTNLRLQL